MNNKADNEVTLRFDQVSMNGKKVPRFDLSLNGGDLIVFELSNSEAANDIPGLASGVTPPRIGEIFCCGKNWQELHDDAAIELRLQIGQVYNSTFRASWIENLDIDENVYLAQQMAGGVTQQELADRALALARSFGMDSLPHARRSYVSRKDLMRAQWVRAFLPDPLKLLILERPTLGMESDSVSLLVSQINKVRRAGTAVLWLDNSPGKAEYDQLSPTELISPTPPALLSRGPH